MDSTYNDENTLRVSSNISRALKQEKAKVKEDQREVFYLRAALEELDAAIKNMNKPLASIKHLNASIKLSSKVNHAVKEKSVPTTIKVDLMQIGVAGRKARYYLNKIRSSYSQNDRREALKAMELCSTFLIRVIQDLRADENLHKRVYTALLEKYPALTALKFVKSK